ncbi:MAG: hypothetical protein ABIH42_11510, partial [Planctomycetota bacterium]
SSKAYLEWLNKKPENKKFVSRFLTEGALLLPNIILQFLIGTAFFFLMFIPISNPPLSFGVGKISLNANIWLGFLFIFICGIFYSSLVQTMTFLLKRAGREIAVVLSLLIIMLPGIKGVTRISTGSGAGEVFNPIVILVSILDIDTANYNFPLVAFLFYGIAGLLLTVFVFFRVRRDHSELM